ncbi:hypothetical protein STEG23_014956 [Scotinomys teguina]
MPWTPLLDGWRCHGPLFWTVGDAMDPTFGRLEMPWTPLLDGWRCHGPHFWTVGDAMDPSFGLFNDSKSRDAPDEEGGL